jgi:hypothetical protein
VVALEVAGVSQQKVDAVEHGVLCPLQKRCVEYRVFNPQTPISGSDIWQNHFLTVELYGAAFCVRTSGWVAALKHTFNHRVYTRNQFVYLIIRWL